MKLNDELEIMDALHPNGAYSLRLWVVGSPDGGTWCNIDWVKADEHGRHAHAARVSRETWKGDLDCLRRAMILAIDTLSKDLDKAPPLPGT